MDALKLVFMGTPDFSIPSLELLHRSKHLVEAVVTQPDRPAGRGQKLTSPPVKEWALKQGLEVKQPTSLKEKDFLEYLRMILPDIIVVVAYGNIIPSEIIDFPPAGCLNLHPSLLPRYRGAAPIQRAIMDGEQVTGVSVILVSPELDAGDIVMQEEEPIYPDDCAGDLHDRLSRKGASLMLKSVEAVARGEARPVSQHAGKVTYADPLRKGEEVINWTDTARDIFNRIRALSPFPGASTYFKNRRLKLKKAVLPSRGHVGKPGEVLGLQEEGIEVAAGDGSIIITRVQPEGKKEMEALDFWRGYRLEPGCMFAEKD